MLPVAGFAATPAGPLNWPSAEAAVPKLVTKLPVMSNTWILLLPKSAT